MKTADSPIMPRWLSRILLGSLVLIFVLMPLHAFLSTWGGTAIGPLWLWKSWKELLIVAMSGLVVGWLLTRPRLLRQLLTDKLIVITLAYVGLTLLLALVWRQENGAAATAAGVAMNLRYLALAAIAYVTLRYSEIDWLQLSRYARRFLIGAGVFVAALGILQVTLLPLDTLTWFGYDKDTTIAPYTLIDENEQAPRAFATLSGPNDYGAWLILPLTMALLIAGRSPWLLAAAGVILLGLYESSSRSAWLATVIAIGALAWLAYGWQLLRTRTGLWSMAVVALVGAVVLISAISIPAVRLEVFHSSPSDPSLIEGSTAKHFQATAAGVQRVIEQPLGCGPGCSGPASSYSDQPLVSENYYVQIAEEVGVIGLALWLAIASIVAVRLYQLTQSTLLEAWPLAVGLLTSFVGLSAIGFWLHVWADDPVSLTWWALAGALLGAASRKSTKRVR